MPGFDIGVDGQIKRWRLILITICLLNLNQQIIGGGIYLAQLLILGLMLGAARRLIVNREGVNEIDNRGSAELGIAKCLS
jgi:hypothetical protein